MILLSWKPSSLHLNDVVRLPRLIEERLRRAVEAHIREPAPARHRLDPVLLLAGCHLRAEKDVHRTIGVHGGAGVLADARKPLAVLQLGAAQRVVYDHGPEELHRDVRRQMEAVALAAVEECSAGVTGRPIVLRPCSDDFQHLAGRVARGGVDPRARWSALTYP